MNSTLLRTLSAPVGNAPLVVWRVLFGLLMLAESWGAIATGWVRTNLVAPDYTFPFFIFDGWLAPLPGWGMYAYFGVMGCAAIGVALGYRYRVSAVLLALLWTGAYLLQKTSYNNHYYLAVLLCWWMCIVPADQRLALGRATRSLTHRWWVTGFAKAQLLIVFTYGAVAKLYPGWWRGEFIEQTFGSKADYPIIGAWLQEPWLQQFITFGAVAFDASIIPLLLWRRTRWLAWWGLVGFNLFNSIVFRIGIFPYLVLAMTVFFFEPARVEAWLRRLFPAAAEPVVEANTSNPRLLHPAFVAVLAVYFAIQLALPLRHHFIAGDVNWTEEGHRLSWRMMTRAKAGDVYLEVRDATGQRVEPVQLSDYLTRKQVNAVATRPDFLWQLSRRLRNEYRAAGWDNPGVYVRSSRVWLNGVGPAPLYLYDVDIAAAKRNPWGRNDWVTPYGERAASK